MLSSVNVSLLLSLVLLILEKEVIVPQDSEVIDRMGWWVAKHYQQRMTEEQPVHVTICKAEAVAFLCMHF